MAAAFLRSIMVSFLFIVGVLPLGALSATIPTSISYKVTCKAIDVVLSKASGVFYPGSAEYERGNEHWNPASTENSTCVVEPGSATDVSRILKVLAQTTTPFGIKSGGHATVTGFSSTKGVQIALSRLNQTIYNRKTQTVDIGPGQAWDAVYGVLQTQGVTVAGGRITGVGVGGYILGGGYSWISNAVGLGVDNVLGFELVLPNGKIVEVTETSQPDLFFGLTGGFNNYGIMTRVTMKAYPQGDVWGGIIRYVGDSVALASAAILDYYQTNTNNQAAVLTAYEHTGGSAEIDVTLFYNATSPPAGLFDRFLNIPSLSQDLAQRNFTSFVTAASLPYQAGFGRGAIGALAVTDLTEGILNQALNITKFYDDPVRFAPGGAVVVTIEPFLKAPLTVANYDRTGYPHFKYGSPSSVFFAWPNATYDDKGHKGIQGTIAALRAEAEHEGQNLTDITVYSNYALGDQPLPELYNVNLNRLKQLRKQVDPKGLMLRTGGFKLV